ncbi:hypothetical protein ACFTXM_30835 [Streptomyces sp. NPDC056930]|uniref:hypothetical protein n=1 Tax=unclassified Streptomyces TaxID=2593676 RepID=UPI0036290D41
MGGFLHARDVGGVCRAGATLCHPVAWSWRQGKAVYGARLFRLGWQHLTVRL